MKLLLTIISVCLFSSLRAQVADTLYFDSDVSTLIRQHKGQLDAFLINWDAKSEIQISGHADSNHNEVYNLSLSQKRANGVHAYFLGLGIDSSRLVSKALGEHRSWRRGLKYDRRVVVVAENSIATSINDFYTQSRLAIQSFCIDPTKDTTIHCEGGSIVHIANGTFGVGSECVTIQIKEAILFSDMLLENLSTTSNGQLLQTQGMIYVNAMLNGDTLKPKKDLALMIPTDEVIQAAGVFTGARDPHNKAINWTLNNNSVLRSFTLQDFNACKNYDDLCRFCQETNELDSRLALDSLTLRCRDYLFDCIRDYLTCDECKFLLCRVKRFPKSVKGIFSKRTRYENKSFRWCQRQLRRNNSLLAQLGGRTMGLSPRIADFIQSLNPENGGRISQDQYDHLQTIAQIINESDNTVQTKGRIRLLFGNCERVQELFSQYGVDNLEDLTYAVNKPLMEEFGVRTIDGLDSALKLANLNKIELAYKNQRIAYNDFKYYVFNTSSLGWSNIDVFTKLADGDLADFTIEHLPDSTVDYKLVYTERAFVLPSEPNEDGYTFKQIPKNEKAYLVGLKYLKGVPYLALQLISPSTFKGKLEFEELSLEELKNRLKVLDLTQ
jgi:hypothetical protein